MEESPNNEPWQPHMLAPRLVAARKAVGLNKTDFAAMIGIDKSSYTKMESGIKPLLPHVAYKIWELYGIDLNFIYLGQVGGLPLSLSSKVINHLNNPTE